MLVKTQKTKMITWTVCDKICVVWKGETFFFLLSCTLCAGLLWGPAMPWWLDTENQNTWKSSPGQVIRCCVAERAKGGGDFFPSGWSALCAGVKRFVTEDLQTVMAGHRTPKCLKIITWIVIRCCAGRKGLFPSLLLCCCHALCCWCWRFVLEQTASTLFSHYMHLWHPIKLFEFPSVRKWKPAFWLKFYWSSGTLPSPCVSSIVCL